MHVFGYGSLMWKQGFPYEEMKCGYIKGFKRRFWQGSEDHRGQPGQPGRVASIMKSDDSEDRVLGVAFCIHSKDEDAVRTLLADRETGYNFERTLFYPINDNSDHCEPIELEVFMANVNVDTYLGPASEKDIAWQIYHAQGEGGANVDYLLRLIWHSRKLFPDHRDEHLDVLEKETHEIAKKKGDVLEKLYTLQ